MAPVERPGRLVGWIPLLHDPGQDGRGECRTAACVRGGWIGIWLICWLVAFAIEMVLVRAGGPLANPYLTGGWRWYICRDGGGFASDIVVSLLAQPGAGQPTLAIVIGR